MFSPSAARTQYYSYMVPDSHSLRCCNIAYVQHHSSFANSLKSIFKASLKVSVAVTVALVIVEVKWNGRISKRARTNSRNVHDVLLKQNTEAH